jgi:hypothetical protein
MRLARTAAPLPRCKRRRRQSRHRLHGRRRKRRLRSGRQESNLRSPVPKTGGVADSPTASRTSTPGGTRTRASGLRARHTADGGGGKAATASSRHRKRCLSTHRPRGREKLRRQGSNLRLAINSRASYRSTTPERNGGSRIRTCGRAAHACALAPRCLNPLAGKRSYRQSRHDLLSDVASAVAASKTEGEGVEPPRPRSPAVFETVYRASGSPSNVWPRQDSNLHHTD